MRQPGGLACGDKAVDQRMQITPVLRDEQRPAGAAPRVAACLIVFHRAIGGQHLVPAPAGVPRRRPILVIAAMPPDIDHRIDRRGAAQQLAPWPMVPLPRQPRIRLGLVHPVHRRIIEQLAVAQRHLHIEPPVRPPRLDHQHPEPPIGTQPFRQNRPGRARADDDEIRIVHDCPRFGRH